MHQPRPVAILAGLAAGGVSAAGTICVPGDAATIQAGINLARSGLDEVVVADGTWTGKGNTNLDFGGKSITVRSAGGDPGRCVIDCVGAGRGLLFRQGETAATVVLGITVTGGDADYGGGVIITGAAPTLVACRFDGNHALLGGGLYAEAGSPTLIDCRLSANEADLGAGLYVFASTLLATGCELSANTAAVSGGGAYVAGTTASFTTCTFAGNTAVLGGGGGLYHISGAATVTGCVFTGNDADHGGGMLDENAASSVTGCLLDGNTAVLGGGFYSQNASLDLAGCTFRGNTADDGGGLHAANGRRAGTVAGCLFDGNTAATSGGAFAARITVGNTLVNCTLVANAAPAGAGLAVDATSPLAVHNAILWGHDGPVIDDPASLVAVSHSVVEGGWPGASNLDADPLFADPAGADGVPGTADDDLRLSTGSPCIDAADSTVVPAALATDLDGGPRFIDDPDAPDTGVPDGLNPIADLGVYERRPACLADCADRDGTVGVTDLMALLAQWGQSGGCDLGAGAPGVGVEDLLALLVEWGECG